MGTRTAGWLRRTHTSILPGALALGLLGTATAARAEDLGAARKPIRLDDLPAWSARASVGFGTALSSVHQELLEQEGYHGGRWVFSASVDRRIYRHWGIGLVGLYGARSLEPEPREGATELSFGPSPRYLERHTVVGLEAPMTFVLGRMGGARGSFVDLSLVPWGGVVFGTMDFYGDGEWRTGPAFGGTARLMLRNRHGGAGFALGGYSARIRLPGGLAIPADFGSVFVSLVGGFDVG